MKIIVVSQFEFLLRRTENMSSAESRAHALSSLLHFIITMTSLATGTLLKDRLTAFALPRFGAQCLAIAHVTFGGVIEKE
jgi:hypothetical protein